MTPPCENGIPFPVLPQSPILDAVRNVAAIRPATPFILVNQLILNRNLDRLATYASDHGLNVRPHAKTHKSLEIARWQLERGAIGLTVAKPGEGEVLADACSDLLLAYPVIEPLKAVRVAALASSNDVKVAVDSPESLCVLSAAAAKIGATISILIDLDVGLHRTGVQSPGAAVRLAECADRLPNLLMRGIFCYPGHIWSPVDCQQMPLSVVSDLLQETIDLFTRRGTSIDIVSGGSTPTAYQSHFVPQLTEIRPGTYLFNDINTVSGGYASLDDCAAVIVATVVSNAISGQIVIDAGSKTLAADRCVTHPDSGYGRVVEYPAARITKLSEEHGQIDVSLCAVPPKIGERIAIIPNHICPCINLQDSVWLETSVGELVAMSVDARGKVT